MNLKIGTSNVLNLGNYRDYDSPQYFSISFENWIGFLKIDSLFCDKNSSSVINGTSNIENDNILQNAMEYKIIEIPFIVDGISRTLPVYTFPNIDGVECSDYIYLKMKNLVYKLCCIITSRKLYLILMNDNGYSILYTQECDFKTTNVVISENPFKGNDEMKYIYIIFSSTIQLFVYEAIIYVNNLNDTELKPLKRYDIVVSCLSVNNSKKCLYVASHNFNLYILDLMDINLEYSHISVKEVVKSITHSSDDKTLILGLWNGRYNIFYNKKAKNKKNVNEHPKVNQNWKNIGLDNDPSASSRNIFLNFTAISRNERYIFLSSYVNVSPWRITDVCQKRIESNSVLIDYKTGKIIPLKLKNRETFKSSRIHFKGMIYLPDRNCLLLITNDLRFEKVSMPISTMIHHYKNKNVDSEVICKHDPILGDSKIEFVGYKSLKNQQKLDYYDPINLRINVPRKTPDGKWINETKLLSTKNILPIQYIEPEDFSSSGKNKLVVALSSKRAFLWIKNTNIVYYTELNNKSMSESVENIDSKDSNLPTSKWKSIVLKQTPKALSCGIDFLMVRFDQEEESTIRIYDVEKKSKLLTILKVENKYKNNDLYKIYAEKYDDIENSNIESYPTIVLVYKSTINDYYIKYVQYGNEGENVSTICQSNIIEREIKTNSNLLCYHNNCLVFVDKNHSSILVYNILFDEWKESENKYQSLSESIFELCKIINK